MDLATYRKAHVQKEMAFSDAEYAERLAKVRKKMAADDIDCMLVTHMPNVCYLTGYQTPMCDWYVCLVVPMQGEVHLQVCDLPLAVLTTTVKNISNTRWDRMSSAVDELVGILNGLTPTPKRIGIEIRKTGMNPYTYDLLRRNFPNASFVDASHLVARIRVVKSPAEVECIRTAARFTDAGIDAAIRAIRPGATENTLAAAGSEAMIAAGSEFYSIDPFIRCGARSGFLHATYKRGFVKPGDPIVLEFAAVYQRYSAPKYATAVMGEPSEQMRAFSDIILSTIDILYSNLRPGRTIDEVARAATKGLSSVGEGVELGRDRHGYAVGIGFPPDWVEHSLTLGEGVEDVLEPGMVFHTPRSLRIPGVMSTAFSETMLITETGCEALTHYPRELIVI